MEGVGTNMIQYDLMWPNIMTHSNIPLEPGFLSDAECTHLIAVSRPHMARAVVSSNRDGKTSRGL